MGILLFLRANWIILALAALALIIVGLAFYITHQDAAASRVEAAQAQEKADTLSSTVNRMEKANGAAAQVLTNSSAAHDECVRYSRTPENCS